MASDILNGNGNGSKVEQAAENALLKFTARVMMAVGVPAIFLVGSWLGGEVWSTSRKTNDVTIRLEEKIGNLLDKQLPDLSNRFNDRINVHAERLNSIDRRNDSQDGAIDELRRRVYSIPRNPPQ